MQTKFVAVADLSLATTLFVSGVKLESLDRSKPRIQFNFRRVEGLDDLIEAYWRKELKIEPIAFTMAQKFLKNQLFNRS